MLNKEEPELEDLENSVYHLTKNKKMSPGENTKSVDGLHAGEMRHMTHGANQTSWEKYCQIGLKGTVTGE